MSVLDLDPDEDPTRPANQPLEDTINLFAVGGSSDGRTSIIKPATRITRQEALNLCAWLSVVADLKDEELLAARRQVEDT